MWDKIFLEFQKHPRDLCTVPTRGQGVWFYVWTEGTGLYVANSKNHTHSSKIQGRRRLNSSECDTLLDLYKRRCRGEAVSKQATAATVNQVYWYGIFHALGL